MFILVRQKRSEFLKPDANWNKVNSKIYDAGDTTGQMMMNSFYDSDTVCVTKGKSELAQ